MKIKMNCAVATKVLTAITSAALYAILISVSAVNFTLAFKSGRNPGKVSDINGYVPLLVDSNSMSCDKSGAPNIERGDLIVVAPTDVDCLKAGNVIAFYNSDGAVTTHRIVRIVNDQNGNTAFRTKGDAEGSIEDLEIVSKSSVIGIYRGKIPGFGSFFEGLQSGGAATAFVLAPLAAIVTLEYLVRFAAKIIRTRKENSQEDKPDAAEKSFFEEEKN